MRPFWNGSVSIPLLIFFPSKKRLFTLCCIPSGFLDTEILGMVSFDYSHNLTDRVDSVFSNLVLVSIPQRSTFYNKLDNLAVQ